MTQANHVDFDFTRAWIHAGVEYKPGDKAQFGPATATMLADAGAGRPVTPGKYSKRRAAGVADGNDLSTIGDTP